MKRTIGRLAMTMLIATSGIPAASAANASTVPAAKVPAASLPTATAGCTLTVARPVRLAYYIHATATLRCTNNVKPSSILIDLGYSSFWGDRSVMRKWYDVPAKVNRSFGLLYSCPGGKGGTKRTWSMDSSSFIKYPLPNGKFGFAQYDKSGPAATFRC